MTSQRRNRVDRVRAYVTKEAGILTAGLAPVSGMFYLAFLAAEPQEIARNLDLRQADVVRDLHYLREHEAARFGDPTTPQGRDEIRRRVIALAYSQIGRLREIQDGPRPNGKRNGKDNSPVQVPALLGASREIREWSTFLLRVMGVGAPVYASEGQGPLGEGRVLDIEEVTIRLEARLKRIMLNSGVLVAEGGPDGERGPVDPGIITLAPPNP